MDGWNDEKLRGIETAHPDGMSVQQIVKAFAQEGLSLTEATFRKYVQLGLLPRSVRVGRKGKHRGSQGLYPATVVRQIDHLRRLMGQGFTIEEIQRQFLSVRSDFDALQRQMEKVFAAIERAQKERAREHGEDPLAARALTEARETSQQLITQLESIERRLSMRARMARAAV